MMILSNVALGLGAGKNQIKNEVDWVNIARVRYLYGKSK